MAGLIKVAALLLNILVVQCSILREKQLHGENHIEQYKSIYSDPRSDDFGRYSDFGVEKVFMPKYQRPFVFEKMRPDWLPRLPSGSDEAIKFDRLGPIHSGSPAWPASIGRGKIGYPWKIPGSVRRNGKCQNIKGLPTPESGCCGVEVTRPPINQQHPGYPVEFWPENENGRRRRSTDSDKPPNKMIRGGRATDLRQLPWTVRLAIHPRMKGLHSPDYCGGTIISSRYVLTAAHCVYNTFKDLSQLEIFLAEYDTDTYPEDCTSIKSNGKKECVNNIVRKVDHVILHKDYNDTYLQNDVALLRLTSDIPYTEFIRPICLPTADIAHLKDEKNIIIAGWGLNGKRETNVKQAANVNYVSNDKCKEQYSYKDDSIFCSIGDHGEDICHGDSGGPLMVLSKNRYFLSGVVSGKRGGHECGSAVSSLFNNVFYHKEWIVKHVK